MPNDLDNNNDNELEWNVQRVEMRWVVGSPNNNAMRKKK